MEIFRLTFPEVSVKADELAVLSWILPHMRRSRLIFEQTTDPSEKWIRARIYGEEFNEELSRYVVASLVKAGHPALLRLFLQLQD